MDNQLSISKIEYCPFGPTQQKLLVVLCLTAMVSGDLIAIFIAIGVALFGNSVGGANGGKIILVAAIYLVFALIGLNQNIGSMRKSLLKTAQSLVITSVGAIFPFGALFQLRGRRWRRWKELSQVLLRWQEGCEFKPEDAIVLRFKDGCEATIALQATSNQELEKLIVALEMWVPQSALTANFSELRGFISPALRAQGISSYTALWNDELSRRFSQAAFIVLPPNTKLQNGRYEIVSQLCFGGFSAVYNGIDSRGQQVVVKELSLAHLENEKTRESLLQHIEREAALLSKLNHSRICHLLDTFVERDRQYLVLEKIPGKTLRQIVSESGPLSEKAVLALSLQMVEILDYLHGQSPPMVHRDFTPDNLIVRDGNYLILIDFNAATEFMSGATGTIIGKHHYMPPEQIKGKAQPSSDYYSMAGTLSFLLTGKEPRPLAQVELKAAGVQISSKFSDLLTAMTKMDMVSRPDLAQIAATLQDCASVRT
ncbi:MAG: serine/threonine protein kinase [Candidatus Obscuribacter sp.]|nr:serine/threonine protein kinase [Candidatus Obscuribacter sp.]MBK7840841.1 serine/threonine protein kinase [Candidatus Obscuribacter sp.]MBK9621063.1 serine/threonine protein kinase [Candidatus Obscuribacter sp.]MBK9771527.1 serine/threonine protein kinase [Candidatus Obscuribacter sp.]MDQ5964318.1 eukaryotic-like serine/threonine-protein kinase [Cyanobacteriota bacterium erpe_2018_sw_39hr_WHONDRS-SW48-000098_B_bin.30]